MPRCFGVWAMTANVVMTHLTLSALTVAAINWLKNNNSLFPWITKEKTNLLRGLSALGAIAAAVGIHTTWSGANHSLTITGLSLSTVALAAWNWLKQFALNEMVFQSTKKQPGLQSNGLAFISPTIPGKSLLPAGATQATPRS